MKRTHEQAEDQANTPAQLQIQLPPAKPWWARVKAKSPTPAYYPSLDSFLNKASIDHYNLCTGALQNPQKYPSKIIPSTFWWGEPNRSSRIININPSHCSWYFTVDDAVREHPALKHYECNSRGYLSYTVAYSIEMQLNALAQHNPAIRNMHFPPYARESLVSAVISKLIENTVIAPMTIQNRTNIAAMKHPAMDQAIFCAIVEKLRLFSRVRMAPAQTAPQQQPQTAKADAHRNKRQKTAKNVAREQLQTTGQVEQLRAIWQKPYEDAFTEKWQSLGEQGQEKIKDKLSHGNDDALVIAVLLHSSEEDAKKAAKIIVEQLITQDTVSRIAALLAPIPPEMHALLAQQHIEEWAKDPLTPVDVSIYGTPIVQASENYQESPQEWHQPDVREPASSIPVSSPVPDTSQQPTPSPAPSTPMQVDLPNYWNTLIALGVSESVLLEPKAITRSYHRCIGLRGELTVDWVTKRIGEGIKAEDAFREVQYCNSGQILAIKAGFSKDALEKFTFSLKDKTGKEATEEDAERAAKAKVEYCLSSSKGDWKLFTEKFHELAEVTSEHQIRMLTELKAVDPVIFNKTHPWNAHGAATVECTENLCAKEKIVSHHSAFLQLWGMNESQMRIRLFGVPSKEIRNLAASGIDEQGMATILEHLQGQEQAAKGAFSPEQATEAFREMRDVLILSTSESLASTPQPSPAPQPNPPRNMDAPHADQNAGQQRAHELHIPTLPPPPLPQIEQEGVRQRAAEARQEQITHATNELLSVGIAGLGISATKAAQMCNYFNPEEGGAYVVMLLQDKKYAGPIRKSEDKDAAFDKVLRLFGFLEKGELAAMAKLGFSHEKAKRWSAFGENTGEIVAEYCFKWGQNGKTYEEAYDEIAPLSEWQIKGVGLGLPISDIMNPLNAHDWDGLNGEKTVEAMKTLINRHKVLYEITEAELPVNIVRNIFQDIKGFDATRINIKLAGVRSQDIRTWEVEAERRGGNNISYWSAIDALIKKRMENNASAEQAFADTVGFSTAKIDAMKEGLTHAEVRGWNALEGDWPLIAKYLSAVCLSSILGWKGRPASISASKALANLQGKNAADILEFIELQKNYCLWQKFTLEQVYSKDFTKENLAILQSHHQAGKTLSALFDELFPPQKTPDITADINNLLGDDLLAPAPVPAAAPAEPAIAAQNAAEEIPAPQPAQPNAALQNGGGRAATYEEIAHYQSVGKLRNKWIRGQQEQAEIEVQAAQSTPVSTDQFLAMLTPHPQGQEGRARRSRADFTAGSDSDSEISRPRKRRAWAERVPQNQQDRQPAANSAVERLKFAPPNSGQQGRSG